MERSAQSCSWGPPEWIPSRSKQRSSTIPPVPIRLLYLLLCLPLAALGGEAGYMSREVELRVAPAGGSAVVGKVAKGEKLEILAEQRSWSQVRAGNQTGWALSFYVMKGEPAPERRVGRRLGELFSLGTERRAETTATIGIRGLDEEQDRKS